MNKKKKVSIIIFSCVLALAVATATVFYLVFVERSVTGDAGVAEGYYLKTDPQGELEKKYNSFGKYDVKYTSYEIDDSEAKKLHVWYPEKLEKSDSTYPMVIMTNGSTLTADSYKTVFEHLASWGFIVVGDENKDSNTGRTSSVALDWMLRQNNDDSSFIFGKIDCENIGIAGHSQGGAGAINAATVYENSSMFTSLYTASGASLWASQRAEYLIYDVSKIKIPYFMISGTGNIDRYLVVSPKSLKENYNNLPEGVPAVVARRKGIDHSDVLEYGDAYMTAWFKYTLMNDEEAGRVFFGNDAELLSNPSWKDIHLKNLQPAN